MKNAMAKVKFRLSPLMHKSARARLKIAVSCDEEWQK